MYIEGDTLYSYGRHFPLLIRKPYGYLMNADKYSVTTSGHQSCASRIATIAIPFSVLQSANINEFELVSKEPARYDTRTYKDKDGIEHTVEERRPEACIIKDGNRYFISSMDEGSYFLSELPKPCNTATEALDMLILEGVKGKDCQRQGEWFVINATIPSTLVFNDAKGMYKIMERDYELPHNDGGNTHTATRGCFMWDKHFISGQLRHPEHRMLRLSKADNPMIFEAYENTAVNSWSAGGNVA